MTLYNFKPKKPENQGIFERECTLHSCSLCDLVYGFYSLMLEELRCRGAHGRLNHIKNEIDDEHSEHTFRFSIDLMTDESA